MVALQLTSSVVVGFQRAPKGVQLEVPRVYEVKEGAVGGF